MCVTISGKSDRLATARKDNAASLTEKPFYGNGINLSALQWTIREKQTIVLDSFNADIIHSDNTWSSLLLSN
jgi:hypothetical protein